MTTSTHSMITRPDGYSAKTTHQAGALNHHLNGSGENPMVDSPVPVEDSTGGPISDRDRLYAALIGPVYEIADQHVRLRTYALRYQREVLWELLKAQTRAARTARQDAQMLADVVWTLSQENAALTVERDALHTERDALAAQLSEPDSAGHEGGVTR